MSQPTPTQPRPTQVTAAAWMIMVGSVFVVLMVWDRIAGLHSIDSQKALQNALDTPGVRGSGLEMADLMAIVKTVSMVGAGCATAMVILGYQTLHRSRSARLALSVLAVPLFICGLVTGGFVAAVVVAAVATLWLRPARLWFDGGTATAPTAAHPSLQRRDPGSAAEGGPSAPRHQPPAQPTQPTQPPAQPTQPPAQPTQPPAQPTPASQQWPSAPPAQQPWSAPPTWAPPPTSAYDVWPRPRAALARRPGAVVGACVVTWVMSALSLVTLVGSILVLVTDSSTVLDKMHQQNPRLAEQGVTDQMILVTAFALCGLFVLWGLAAVVFAVSCFRGRRWGWFALMISASCLATLSLLGVIASLVMLVPLATGIAVLVLLSRPDVRAWIR